MRTSRRCRDASNSSRVGIELGENTGYDILEIITMDSQANDDLKRVVDMAAESVAKQQRLNYGPPLYANQNVSQNTPPPGAHYPSHNNQYHSEASGTNTVAPLSNAGRIANNDALNTPYNRVHNHLGF